MMRILLLASDPAASASFRRDLERARPEVEIVEAENQATAPAHAPSGEPFDAVVVLGASAPAVAPEATAFDALADVALWRKVFEGWRTGVVMVATDGTIDYANPAYLDMVGFTAEELGGRSFLDVTHLDDRDAYWRLFAELMDGARESFLAEKRCVRKDGTTFWNRVSVSALRSPGNTPNRAVAVVEDLTDRLDSESERRRLSERLAATLEHISDAFFTVDNEWRFSFLNREAERLLETPREKLLGQVLWDMFPDARGTESERSYTRAMETGEAVHFQQHYPPLERWFEAHAYPSDEGLAVYFRDVSERVRSEALLRESEERFRIVARATSDVIWDWDARTDAVWWSDGMESTFGIDPAEVAPTFEGWTERIHPDDRARVLSDVEAVVEGTGGMWTGRYRLRRGDGTYAIVFDRGWVIRDEQGRAVRMVGGVTDETVRIEAERKIQEQAELLSKARDAILVRDMDQLIRFWNDGAEHLYGWTSREVEGRSAGELLHADLEAFREATARVLDEGEWNGELEQRRKDGSIVAVEGRWTLVRDDHGQPSKILAINTDITERKRLLAQFLRAQRMESIGTLAGGIAHDLNNVLQPILLAMELVKAEVVDPETSAMLDTIESSARRGANMVQQVLSFARGVEGAEIGVDLGHIIEELERIARETFPKNIALWTRLPDDLWHLVGDPIQIHQVFLNLALNARDAMPDGGTLDISAENLRVDEHYAILTGQATAGPCVRVTVTDSGGGMSSEVLEQIFDPFFTTKEPGRGTGLGLSTVAAIVRSHGGVINVYSEPGQGTTFRLYLPASLDEREVGHAEAGEGLPHGHGEQILVVDDEESVRRITRRTLEAFGYRVVAAADGKQGLARYGERGDEIDLVLTDLMMPVMDGPAMIRALKQLDPDVRIVAVSGMGARGGVANATDLGVHYFLPKPYSAAALLDVVHRILHEP
jgi:PAS domain S-box-containing protein